MRFRSTRVFALLAVMSGVALGSCKGFETNVQDTSVEQKETARQNFEAAEAAFAASRWSEAVKYFELVKNKYPYSKYAVLAELRLSDTHFAREKWLEAADGYRIFVRFHPRHEQVAYATFRVALSHARAIEDNVSWLPFVEAKEKDQAAAKDTIRACDEFLTRFPDDKNVAEAKKLRSEARSRLAEVDLYAADFYLKREKWQGAMWRFHKVGNDYGDTAQAPWALLQAGAIAQDKLHDSEQARAIYEQLVREHPEAPEVKDAKEALARLGERPAAAAVVDEAAPG
ncbi:MAG: outer membrane protein assembly factor BamD [Deltaproteobacteria bacterium]|nr:outer membrane protein assembly factor BamD [Deltaproteobacteria bacterium]